MGRGRGWQTCTKHCPARKLSAMVAEQQMCGRTEVMSIAEAPHRFNGGTADATQQLCMERVLCARTKQQT